MRFSTVSILGFAAAALAAPVPAGAKWDVTYEKAGYANGYKSEKVTAVYTSSANKGITSTCTYTYNPATTPKESKECSNGLKYSYDGTTITISQPINNKSLSGSSPLKLTTGPSGRTSSGKATVVATASA